MTRRRARRRRREPRPRAAPASTYRLQLGPALDFDGAARLVSYLDALGIGAAYLSPCFAARPKSEHGYDVVDPTRIAPELGGEPAFLRLSRALRRRGMGLVLDIVPNHMAAHPANPWWRDVLESGRESPYAAFFDVDWNPPQPRLAEKALVPILGRPYEQALEQGELALALSERGLELVYGEHALPIDPATWGKVLRAAIDSSARAEPADRDALARLARRVERLHGEAGRRAGRGRVRAALAQLVRGRAGVRRMLDAALEGFNGTAGERSSFDALDRLLAEQNWRIAFWRRAQEEINYRRFFNIAELVGLRMERAEVFEAWHSLLLRLVREGHATGVRVDHVDGLRDPTGYLRELRARLGPAIWLAVEKVLEPGEPLHEGWPVDGTTGYEALALFDSVLVDPQGARDLGAAHARFTGSARRFEDVAHEAQLQVARMHFAGDLTGLGQELGRLAAQEDRFLDLRLEELLEALTALTASFPVYRTYVRDARPRPGDARAVRVAVRDARRRDGGLSPRALELVRRAVLVLSGPRLSAKQRRMRLEFAQRWQQLTGPIMAKGVEDTAFYRFNRLIALNEVGCDPGSDGIAPRELHRALTERARRWPRAMTTLSTHDTKRGADARARILVLSELAGEWSARVERWREWNEPFSARRGGLRVPDPEEEALLYQTLVGSWPLEQAERETFRERLEGFLVKAAREAKLHTSWLRPDEEHERALVRFAGAILQQRRENRFLPDFLEFQERVARCGAVNSLAQTALALAAPGVFDLYQGCELWDLAMVDPDNRRPVDFGRRARLLAELREAEARGASGLAHELIDSWRDGRAKLHLLWKGLRLRREHRELFAGGSYVPLTVRGERREQAIAFLRRRGAAWALAAAPRCVALLVEERAPRVRGDAWKEARIELPRTAPREWTNVITGEVIAAEGSHGRALDLERLFADFPVALLAGGSARPARLS
jgi:(1->4)-alpha-D-glucan 1-alpha-D-glucosylmutase